MFFLPIRIIGTERIQYNTYLRVPIDLVKKSFGREWNSEFGGLPVKIILAENGHFYTHTYANRVGWLKDRMRRAVGWMCNVYLSNGIG